MSKEQKKLKDEYIILNLQNILIGQRDICVMLLL